jgi:hypothetical protein
MDDQQTAGVGRRGLKAPRFRFSTLLIVITAAALWFSTFARYTGAEDVRYSIMLATALASGAAAAGSIGERRIFWAGFFAAMLAMGGRTFFNFAPRFSWISQLSIAIARNTGARGTDVKHNMEGIQVTLAFGLWIAIFAMIGLLCARVYASCASEKN